MSRHTPEQLATILLAILLVAQALVGPASALADETGATNGPPALDCSQTQSSLGQSGPTALQKPASPNATLTLRPITSTPGRIEVRAVFTQQLPAGYKIFLPTGKSVTVTQTNGFQKQSGNEYELSGTTGTPSITYRINPNSTYTNPYTGQTQYSAIDVGTWALVRGTEVAPRPHMYPSYTWWDNLSFEPHGQGTAIGNTVYLGPSDRRVRQVGSQQIEVVVARPARGVPRTRSQTTFHPKNSVAGLMDVLENVSADFRVGERDPTVTGLITTKVHRSEAEDSGFLLATATYKGSRLFNTQEAIHEYVHTRQNFSDQTVSDKSRAGEQTSWLLEGQARYYEHLFACREGIITSTEFKTAMRQGQIPNVVLADESTWPDPNAKYQKGALVLAALDVEIRNRTNGQKTLQDVFARLNKHEGELNHSVLEDEVAAVAGTRMDSFLTKYVKQDNAPSVPAKTACNRRRIVEVIEPCRPVGIDHVGVFCAEDFEVDLCDGGLCDPLERVGFSPNELAMIRIETAEDGTQAFTARLEDYTVTEVREIEEPAAVDQTITVRTSAETVRNIQAAENRREAVGEAIFEERITVEDAERDSGTQTRLFPGAVHESATDVESAVLETLPRLVGSLV